MQLYLLVIFCFLFGYLLQRQLSWQQLLSLYLNRYIIWFALPALILTTVPGLVFSADHLFSLATPWLLMTLGFVAIHWLGRFLRWPIKLRAAAMLLVGLGNTAFLGVPIIGHSLGESALLSAIVYDQLGSFFILSLVATSMIARFSGESEVSGAWSAIWNIARFPPFIGLLAAFFIPEAVFFGLLQAVLEHAATSLLPVAMVAIGLHFSFQLDRQYILPVAVVLVGKMIVPPIVVVSAGLMFAVPYNVLAPTVMQSAMPPMVTGVILMLAANLEPRFAVTVLGLGTLLACFTLPITIYLLRLYFSV